MKNCWCLERYYELKEIKKVRPLTDAEDEQLAYCEGTLSSIAAEERYYAGETDPYEIDCYWQTGERTYDKERGNVYLTK